MRNNYLRHLNTILQKEDTPKSRGFTAPQSPIIPPEFNAKDWMSFLIHVDAELEHGLMVQYLYAAYSMGGDQITTEEDRKKVRRWQEIILGIAKEEMGHFVSIQNVLRGIGAPLNFGRQDFPWDSELYPFEFSLEPFSLSSLAKYVYAESPVGWLESDSNDPEMAAIKAEIKAFVPGYIDHDPIGALFEQILAIIKDPLLISDDIFLPQTYPYQAKFDEWGRGYKKGARGNATQGNVKGAPDVLVEPITSRTSAIKALEEIAEQGEATTLEDNELSHFERFLDIYKELRKMPEGFSPSRKVAFNPTIANNDQNPMEDPADGISDAGNSHQIDIIECPYAQKWANLFNIRYRMLLKFLTHSFLLDDGLNSSGARTPRGAIIHATFGEMYNLRSLANILVTLPIKQGSDTMAGPPFLVPYTMDLPIGEASKWRVHQDLLEASSRLIEELLTSTHTPSYHKYLYSLREADKGLNDIAHRIISAPIQS